MEHPVVQKLLLWRDVTKMSLKLSNCQVFGQNQSMTLDYLKTGPSLGWRAAIGAGSRRRAATLRLMCLWPWLCSRTCRARRRASGC